MTAGSKLVSWSRGVRFDLLGMCMVCVLLSILCIWICAMRLVVPGSDVITIDGLAVSFAITDAVIVANHDITYGGPRFEA